MPPCAASERRGDRGERGVGSHQTLCGGSILRHTWGPDGSSGAMVLRGQAYGPASPATLSHKLPHGRRPRGRPPSAMDPDGTVRHNAEQGNAEGCVLETVTASHRTSPPRWAGTARPRTRATRALSTAWGCASSTATACPRTQRTGRCGSSRPRAKASPGPAHPRPVLRGRHGRAQAPGCSFRVVREPREPERMGRLTGTAGTAGYNATHYPRS